MKRDLREAIGSARHRVREKFLLPKVARMRVTRAQRQYNDSPRVTAILQCFNKAHTVVKIVKNLRAAGVDEIIAIDDGSVDSTLRRLAAEMDHPNDFIIHSNDLFEIRMYNRALQMSRGEICVLLQDDDLPPADTKWIDSALHAFEQDRSLAILGGRDGMDLMLPDPEPFEGGGVYRQDGDVAGCAGIQKYRVFSSVGLSDVTPSMVYRMAVNRAPMFIRRAALDDIGYADEVFAPFQCDDVDLCLRSWKAGWKVGLYHAGFTYLSQGGMRLYNSKQVPEQVRRNWMEVYRRHGREIASGDLEAMVVAANKVRAKAIV